MNNILQNLISNGVKFRKGEEAPVIKISNIKKTGSYSSGEFVGIHFIDNGIGFDEKYNERIFNIFQ